MHLPRALNNIPFAASFFFSDRRESEGAWFVSNEIQLQLYTYWPCSSATSHESAHEGPAVLKLQVKTSSRGQDGAVGRVWTEAWQPAAIGSN